MVFATHRLKEDPKCSLNVIHANVPNFNDWDGSQNSCVLLPYQDIIYKVVETAIAKGGDKTTLHIAPLCNGLYAGKLKQVAPYMFLSNLLDAVHKLNPSFIKNIRVYGFTMIEFQALQSAKARLDDDTARLEDDVFSGSGALGIQLGEIMRYWDQVSADGNGVTEKHGEEFVPSSGSCNSYYQVVVAEYNYYQIAMEVVQENHKAISQEWERKKGSFKKHENCATLFIGLEQTVNWSRRCQSFD